MPDEGCSKSVKEKGILKEARVNSELIIASQLKERGQALRKLQLIEYLRHDPDESQGRVGGGTEKGDLKGGKGGNKGGAILSEASTSS